MIKLIIFIIAIIALIAFYVTRTTSNGNIGKGQKAAIWVGVVARGDTGRRYNSFH